MLGRRPTATRISSPVSDAAVGQRERDRPVVGGALRPLRLHAEHDVDALGLECSRATARPRTARTACTRCSAWSTTVTSRAPSRFQAWAISHPTTPPPRTSSRSGTAFALTMSRLSQARTSRRPSIGGTSAEEPVAITTALVASSAAHAAALGELDVDAPFADQPAVPPHQLTAGASPAIRLGRVVPVRR